MYHCGNNFLMDMEDLIYDFLTYRKNRFKNEKHKKIAIKMNTDAIPFSVQSLIENVDFDKLPEPLVNKKICFCENTTENKLNNKLDAIIDQVLSDYEYDGSPIFEDNIDREALAQIIQKVIDLAINQIDELKNIKPEKDTQTQNFNMSSYGILKSLIEALIINNIFHRRRVSYDDFNRFMPY